MLEYIFLSQSHLPYVLALIVKPFSYESLIEEAELLKLYSRFESEKLFTGETSFDGDGVYYRILFQKKSDALNFKLAFNPQDDLTRVSGPAW